MALEWSKSQGASGLLLGALRKNSSGAITTGTVCTATVRTRGDLSCSTAENPRNGFSGSSKKKSQQRNSPDLLSGLQPGQNASEIQSSLRQGTTEHEVTATENPARKTGGGLKERDRRRVDTASRRAAEGVAVKEPGASPSPPADEQHLGSSRQSEASRTGCGAVS